MLVAFGEDLREMVQPTIVIEQSKCCSIRGYANYFGVDAKYSDSYVHWLPNKHR